MNLYKLHRKLSLIALFPLLAWTLSGVMHPLMSNLKPKVNQRLIANQNIKNTDETILSVAEIMALNNWTTIQSYRFINYDSSLYYQFKIAEKNCYINAITGKILRDGDIQYATYLAGLYSNEVASKIEGITIQENFSNEYVKIARILPVYKIQYKRMDGLRVFIDVNSDRMTYATNSIRSFFQAFFLWAHSWTFLGFNQTFRLMILGFFVLITFLAGVTGILVYTKFRKTYQHQNIERIPWQRRMHRILGIGLSFTLLLFATSAFMHMLPKYTALDKASFVSRTSFSIDEMTFNTHFIEENWVNHQPVKIEGKVYCQFHFKQGRGIIKKYFDVFSGKELIDGDSIYAVNLAKQYSGLLTVKSISEIKKFENEYGFINKLLPVQKVQFSGVGNPRWYIDTSSSFVGAIIEDKSALSGFIFAYFHKYHVLDFLGKGLRDTILILFALGNFIVSLLGFWMYINTKKVVKKQKQKRQELVY
ncbi:PepSY domain-containing protein [Flammeovirga pectinis]|uniref:PepSY domain-containing protein n=1 Tax=Flammeovirga pectinis TaxID=2494373 RepID=A0A3Q9FNI7_9BACT|nr:PepSY domain-containing protein [Flammeovirga pectinis]AZQ61065.1 PepSY domain-containing protein [Flammeovirga pectinis]